MDMIHLSEILEIPPMNKITKAIKNITAISIPNFKAGLIITKPSIIKLLNKRMIPITEDNSHITFVLLREKDSNLRPPAYEAGELTICSIPLCCFDNIPQRYTGDISLRLNLFNYVN